MMMPTDLYRPAPIETAGISLPSELEGHLERLAEHVHDLWSLRRMTEGWTVGALGESDKDYDRMVARETLKAVIALGYRILPASEPKGGESQQHGRE